MNKRAVIWTAVSSKKQAENDKISLEYQEDRAREWCEANGYTVVEVLCVPGHTRSEPDLVKLLEDYEKINVTAYARLRELWYSKGFDVLVAYSSDRLGRSGTVIHWVMEVTIKHGMRLFLTDDGGWVDEDNHRMRALFGTAQATMPMDALRDKTYQAKEKLVQQGLSVGRWPLSHVPVRDPASGKTLHVIVNEAARPLYTAIARLLIARMPWARIGPELAQQGFLTDKGHVYSVSSLYQFILSPWTFGNSVKGIRANTYGNLRGRWLFDDDVPVPPDITIYRDTVPPMFEGEFMEQLKAELRRRFEIKGRGKPQDAHRFSRLCVCDACGSMLTLVAHNAVGGRRRIGFRCSNANLSIAPHRRCDQKSYTPNTVIQAFVNGVLERLLRVTQDMVDETPLPVPETHQLNQEMDRVTGQIDRLIDEQSLAPISVQPRYRERIERLTKEWEGLQQRHKAALRQEAEQKRVQQSQDQVRDNLQEMGLDRFWQLPDPVLNQTLLRFFGDQRIAIRDRQVVGLKRVTQKKWRIS